MTGVDTNLQPIYFRRAAVLRWLLVRLGLKFGRDVIGLGYVSDDTFYALLNRCWAMVQPTLAEGACLPLMEALAHGIPMVCSDLPVLREQAERLGGEVIWFDPKSSTDLAAKLAELDDHYDTYKERAIEQSRRLNPRSWKDVADEYWYVFEDTVSRA